MSRKPYKFTVLTVLGLIYAAVAFYALIATFLDLFQALLSGSLVLTLAAIGASMALLWYIDEYNVGASRNKFRYRVAQWAFLLLALTHAGQTYYVVVHNDNSWLFWPEVVVFAGMGLALFVRYVDTVKKAEITR